MKKQTVSSSSKKGGIVYIILMALFTLVMLADLLNLALTPVPDTMDFSNLDPSSIPSFNGNSEAPDGQFSTPEGDAPEGFTSPDGEVPEGFTMPEGEAPEEFTPPENGDYTMPEGGFRFPSGDPGELPANGGQPFGSENGILPLVRRAWLPILILCLLGDGVCLFLFIRLRRKSAAGAKQLPAEAEEGSEDGEDDDAGKKKKKRGWILPMCLVIAVAAVIASLPLQNSNTDTVSANEQVVSSTAEKGTISTVLSGTGTLADAAAEQLCVPDSVTVTAYHVNTGDAVTAGDVLASVDKASVGVAIAELQTVIDELDTDLDAASDESADTTIPSSVEGRVKLIYAQENGSVLDTVSEHGCLMLLSLDGLMAVDLEAADGVSVGDTVKVILSDGTEESGRVSAKEDGMLTVTISDESANYGDAVSVRKEGGQRLGEGSLYIHSELRITGYYGIISAVPVEVNTLVDEGDTLLKLSDVGHTSAYQSLLNRRKQLEDQMDSLFRLYQDGYLYAESDGIVSGIPEDSMVVSLSAQRQGNAVNSSDSVVVNTKAVIKNPSGSITERTALSDRGTAQVKPLSNSPTGEDDSAEYAGQQEPTPTDPGTSPLLQNFAAKVVSAGEQVVQFTVSQTAIGEVDYTGLSELAGGSYAYTSSYSCAGDTLVYVYQDGAWQTIRAAELLPGEFCVITVQDGTAEPMTPVWIVCNRAATNPQQPTEPQEPTDPQQPSNPTTPSDPETSTVPSQGGGGSFPSGSTASASFSGAVNESPQEEETKTYEQYSLAEKQVLSITPQKSMLITISVDELDILSIREEQPVKITLEALKGQEFTGAITGIGRTGANEGGNTKYSVTVTLPKEENLIAGMNAAVKITTAESEAAITVPAAALVENGGKTYVYTSYDEKKDALSGLVEVETGASDGTLVEILSGIASGSSVFYRYADTLIYNFFSRIGR